MKYVIDLDEGQLSYIKNVCPGLATMGIASAIDDARPLSELCEEEAKKWDATSKQDVDDAGQWDSESIYSARALRSFGSKS